MRTTTHDGSPAALLLPVLLLAIACAHAEEPWGRAHELKMRPYEASLFNIPAMGFGSPSANAIRALNLGAKRGGFYHDTGEGSISSYHREHGGDLVWEWFAVAKAMHETGILPDFIVVDGTEGGTARCRWDS